MVSVKSPTSRGVKVEGTSTYVRMSEEEEVEVEACLMALYSSDVLDTLAGRRAGR